MEPMAFLRGYSQCNPCCSLTKEQHRKMGTTGLNKWLDAVYAQQGLSLERPQGWKGSEFTFQYVSDRVLETSIEAHKQYGLSDRRLTSMHCFRSPRKCVFTNQKKNTHRSAKRAGVGLEYECVPGGQK